MKKNWQRYVIINTTLKNRFDIGLFLSCLAFPKELIFVSVVFKAFLLIIHFAISCEQLVFSARDPAEIERSNLVNICKLVVKELLEQSVRYGRMLDSDHLPLQHFFIVIEHVLGHGLRTKKV